MVFTRRENQGSIKVSIWILILTNLLVFQLSGWYFQAPDFRLAEKEVAKVFSPPAAAQGPSANPLDVPRGQAVALPSVIIDDSNVGYKRSIYGGKGDKPHLGGFATGSVDMDGVAPTLWKYMVSEIGVKSLLDVGCGRGISTSWFHLHGVETLCVEGSHDAVKQTVLPPGMVTEHDFSRGPWWPSRTVDAVWCVELLEHVGRNFHENLIPAFRKGALVYATHSTWGGWHHVEVHESDWWIQKFESLGFRYSDYLTKQAKKKALQGREDKAPNGNLYKAQHLWLHVMVFINPMVASLPEHHHLFAEDGCFVSYKKDPKTQKRVTITRPCGTSKNKEDKITESVLPDNFLPIKMDESMDKAWEKLVFGEN